MKRENRIKAERERIYKGGPDHDKLKKQENCLSGIG